MAAAGHIGGFETPGLLLWKREKGEQQPGVWTGENYQCKPVPHNAKITIDAGESKRNRGDDISA